MREVSWRPKTALHAPWVPRAEPLRKERAQLDGAAFKAKELLGGQGELTQHSARAAQQPGPRIAHCKRVPPLHGVGGRVPGFDLPGRGLPTHAPKAQRDLLAQL